MIFEVLGEDYEILDWIGVLLWIVEFYVYSVVVVL